MPSTSRDAIPDFGLLYDSVRMYAVRGDIKFYGEESARADGPVLELGCGSGRILLPIARAGKTIVGVDASTAMLERCQAKVASEPDDVRRRITLHQGDVRTFDLDARFALVIVPFRVVQHLTTIDDQLQFLDSVHRHALPGARLIFDVFNPNVARMVAADGQEREDTPLQTLSDGRLFRRTYRVTRVRWVDQVSEVELIYYVANRVGAAEERHVHAFNMRWFWPAELHHLLARGGFHVDAIYGDFDRSPLSDGSPEQIVCTELR